MEEMTRTLAAVALALVALGGATVAGVGLASLRAGGPLTALPPALRLALITLGLTATAAAIAAVTRHPLPFAGALVCAIATGLTLIYGLRWLA